jgi:hypothetical protein
MDHPQGQGVHRHLVAGIEALRRHDRERQFIGRLRPAGEGVFAKRHQLAASEQPVRVDVGRECARFAGYFKQGDAGVDVREIGAGLGGARAGEPIDPSPNAFLSCSRRRATVAHDRRARTPHARHPR